MSEDINVGAISEALNNKADRDMVNSIPPYLVSRTPNEQGGVVEIWSDGYCVQNGKVSGATNPQTVTFDVPFIDNKITVNLTINNSETTVNMFQKISGYSKTSITIITGYSSTAYGYPCWWEAKGYIR